MRPGLLDDGCEIGADRDAEHTFKPDSLPQVHAGTLCPSPISTDELKALFLKHQTVSAAS